MRASRFRQCAVTTAGAIIVAALATSLAVTATGCNSDPIFGGPFDDFSQATTCVDPNIVTTGEDIDPDGYTLVETTIGVGVTGRIEGWSVNDTTLEGASCSECPDEFFEVELELRDVADNCTVAGENPRRVMRVCDETVVVTFEVTCTAITP